MTAFSTRRISTAIDGYYRLLDGYEEHGQLGIESTTEFAMKNLLLRWCDMSGGWTLEKPSMKTPRGNTITPDGTIFDDTYWRRGFWEAKDTADDLKVEIKKKRLAGYPFDKNLFFDDTRQGILYQDNKFVEEIDLRDRKKLIELLDIFFDWKDQPIEEFHQAMAEFNERLPDIAKRLHKRIDDAKKNNRQFVTQIHNFQQMCANSLNPSVTMDQIEQMLAQHLLTERVARRVFHYDRFRETNAVAQELEKLVDSFLGDAPSRDRFLSGLDRYFHALESRAEEVSDLREKQNFLTRVYEPFLNAYSPKEADRQGIVYTPQPIVRFMVNSVEAALQDHFGKSMTDDGVHILDPCTGTGNFLIEVIKKLHDLKPSCLTDKYDGELWANEIMLLPYYIAGLNIETTYHELTGQHRRFPGVCFTDTLLQAKDIKLSLFSEVNAERVERQKLSPITVIIGNPPYNAWQESENQGAKNIPHPVVNGRIKKTYAKDSNATLKNSLYDPYIQFIRWATDRIGDEGVVCFVTNNHFIDGFAADGMRKHLLDDYTDIYHFDLGGNSRIKESGNVFGIRVGVGISLLIKRKGQQPGRIHYRKVEDSSSKEERLSLLSHQETDSYDKIEFNTLKPTQGGKEWFESDNNFTELLLLGNKKERQKRKESAETIFHNYSRGVLTGRDAVVYDFDSWQLEQRVKEMIEAYNLEIDRWKRSGQPKGRELDAFVDTKKVNWSSTLKAHLGRERYADFSENEMRTSLYRPFSKKHLFFNPVLVDRRLRFPRIFPTVATEQENRVINVTDSASEKPFMLGITNRITDLHYVGAGAQAQCFPLYTYDEDGTNRRENITPWALSLFEQHYATEGITPWQIFHYTYALLHASGYRAKYKDNLKKSLPRLPLLGDQATFNRLATLGEELAELHLHYETAERYPLERIEKKREGTEWSWLCPKLRLDNKDKTRIRYNDLLTLAGMPIEALDYRLGNRSAVEWVLNQYKKYPAKDEFVIDLIERVITTSLRTNNLVKQVDELWEG
jgi:predicted helicase